MLGSQDTTFSLDGLFFESPDSESIQQENQGLKSWHLAPAPSISDIPPTQDLQKEAEQCRLLGQCTRTKKFRPPFKKVGENVILTPGHSLCRGFEPMFDAEMKERNTPNMPSSLKSVPLSSKRNQITEYQHLSHPACGEILGDKDLTSCSKDDEGVITTSVFKKSLFTTYKYQFQEADHHSKSLSLDNTGSTTRQIKGGTLKTTHSDEGHHHSSPDLDYSSFSSGKEPSDHESHSFSSYSEPFHTQETEAGSILKPVTEIPTQFRNIFKEFPYFNYIQSKALDDILYTDRNFVICAPTGSGKTVIFELAITRLLMEIQPPWTNVKVVYMAPIKALCSQRFDDWKGKFGPVGLNCKELTGDTQMDDLFEIQHAHIIMTTPEKWDSMTRKWRDNTLVQLVRLFLIDEVHVVKDESRGATLEVVVSRMKTIQSSLSKMSVNPEEMMPMRFVAVSATIPNAEDIAEWLSDGSSPALCLKMDERHRPVKLRKVVLGFPCSSNQTEFKFDLTLNYKIASVIQTYADQKPTLVFCATRKGVQQAASVLAKYAKFVMDLQHKQRLQKSALSIKDSKLRVTTSTLAMGVNLPAHLVVIKSTMHYVGGMFQEYSETDILQMIGRAGRPQFDTTATAVIMTRLSTREKYLHIMNGADTIESSLHRHLIEHLNAEIVLHTITDACIALKWIQSTFLYIRALKNPAHYGFPSGIDKNGIEEKLQELCFQNLNDLSSEGLITMDEDINFKSTETGRLMALYYIAFDTVKQFRSINGTELLPDLISMVSTCKEFSDVQLRTSEKKILNTLNKDKNRITIRYPMEGKIKTREMKVNCLIQAQLGCISIQDFTLTQDSAKIFRNGIRVTKCLSEFMASEEKKFSAFLNSLILAKCFRAKLWENTLHVSKQLEKIGVTLSNAMVNANLTSFKKIEETNARELELILNRHPPFGNQIREAVMHLPKYELSVEQIVRYHTTAAEIVVTVVLKNYEHLRVKRTAPDSHYITLVIGNADNQLIFKQKIPDSVLLKTGNWTKKLEVKRATKSEDLSVNLISSEYVGLDIQQTFTAYFIGHNTNMNIPTKSEFQLKNESIEGSKTKTAKSGYSREESYLHNGKRECNHHCKSKDACGHDCCKHGASQKFENHGHSKFSSYLCDLRNRNAISPAPPVKRLKMQMLKESQNMDQKQVVSTSPSLFPTLSRAEYKQKPFLTSVEEPKSGGVRNSSEQKKKAAHYNFSIWKPSIVSTQKHYQTPPLNIHSCSSFMTNLTDADKKGSRSSGAFNVTFDLGEDVWDDFEDEKLLKAESFTSLSTFNTRSATHNNLKLKTLESKLSLIKAENKLSSPLGCSFSQKQDTSSDILREPENPRSNVKMDARNVHMFRFKEAKDIQQSKASKWDMITSCFTDSLSVSSQPGKEARDSVSPSDEETKAFMSIFDGIF
ncbi:putative ATP-dependent DNA helicase HFM1 isoform X3 [Lissotriton helveticus]